MACARGSSRSRRCEGALRQGPCESFDATLLAVCPVRAPLDVSGHSSTGWRIELYAPHRRDRSPDVWRGHNILRSLAIDDYDGYTLYNL